MQSLKLLALDREDLEVLSAHLQDAVLKVADMAYVPSQQRFAAVANRFDWMHASDEKAAKKKSYERQRSALRFDRVISAQVQDIRLSDKDRVLELLAIQFEEAEPPEGFVTLVFAGGAAVRLHVECIEAELKDFGIAWPTERLPEHAEDDQQATDS